MGNSFFANIFPTGDVDSKTSDTTRNVPEKGANPATTHDVQEEAPSSLIGVVSCAKPNRLTIINYAHDDFVPMHEIVEMENKEKQKTENCEIKEKSRRASIWEQMFGVEAASQEGSTELTQPSSPPKLLQESEVSSSSPAASYVTVKQAAAEMVSAVAKEATELKVSAADAAASAAVGAGKIVLGTVNSIGTFDESTNCERIAEPNVYVDGLQNTGSDDGIDVRGKTTLIVTLVKEIDEKWGLTLQTDAHVSHGRKIVWIADIKDDGAAAKARPSLQVGDIIFKIDDSFADSIDYTACMQESTKVTFTVHRRKEQKMDGDSFNSFFANIFPTGDVDSKTSDTTRNVPEKGANPATTHDVQEEAPSSLIGVVSCAKPNRLTIINYAHDDFVPMHEIVEMENKEKQKTENCEIKEKSRRASIWEQMFGVEAASQEGSTELTQSSSPPKLLQESEVSSSSPVLSLKNTSATVEEIFAEKSLT